jgi:hypothetical protein
MQFEKNKPMFRGLIHKTQFTSTSRSEVGTISDLTGYNKNSSQSNSNYDGNAYLFFGKRRVLQDGSFIDLNLKNNKTQTFAIGSTQNQSFDFWFKQTATTSTKAFLLARSSGISNDLFLENQGSPQLIFIQDGRVNFSFISSSGQTFAGYTTDKVIETNSLYNLIISLNMSAAVGSKVKVYLNGAAVNVTVFNVLEPPVNFRFSNVASNVNIAGSVGGASNAGFSGNFIPFYKISAFDANGESRASDLLSASIDPTKRSIRLNWNPVLSAIGYYIYRSKSASFNDTSLLAEINSKDTTFFIDDNYVTRAGTPKQSSSYVYPYNRNIANLVDDSSAKIVFGDYPLTNLIPNYFEGFIFRISIYNTAISTTQAYKNYNRFLNKFISGKPYLYNEVSRSRSVIHGKVEY